MERLRSLIARASGGARRLVGKRPARVLGVAAMAMAAAFGPIGCMTTDKLKQALPSNPLKLTSGKPATQIICLWQRRLSTLPDPTRDGVVAPGLVGQVFLIASDNQAAAVNGELFLMVSDDTNRPPNQQRMVDEIYHFDAASLQKLITNDERFGKSIAIFLPWPQHWKDVTAVKIQGRYKQKASPDLYAGESVMALDFANPGAPVWSEVGQPGSNPNAPGAQPSANRNGTRETRGVPDLTKFLEGKPSSTSVANKVPVQQPVVPAGGFAPPATTTVQTTYVPPVISGPAPLPPPAASVVPSGIVPPLPPLPTGAMVVPQAPSAPQTLALPVGAPQIVSPNVPPAPVIVPPSIPVPTVPPAGMNPYLTTPSIPVVPPVIAPGQVPPLPNSGSGELKSVVIPRM